MAQYGEILNTYNPGVEDTYRFVDYYFDRPVMVKTEDKNNFSIYMCKIYSLLSIEHRYLIAISPKDNFHIGYKLPLSEIYWNSFQVRNLKDSRKGFLSHRYTIKRTPEYQKIITLRNRDKQASYYDVNNLPITVTLLHGKSSGYAFQKEGTMVLALETFSTILTFK
jgi:hypothetical protein